MKKHRSSRLAPAPPPVSSGPRVALAVTLACALLAATACTGKRPEDLGPAGEGLRPCPSSPNCVSDHPDEDAGHRIEALALPADEPAAALDALAAAVAAMDGAEVIRRDAEHGYLHAEHTSALWGFVDDLELLLDPDEGVVHVRSASRVGYGDLGVNRERVEALRAALAEAPAP